MKTIIAGSRSILHPIHIERAVLFAGIPISEVVCGMASGVDMTGYQWANQQGIKIATFVPDWENYGRQAGMLRNLDMARYADALIAIWDGESRGTDMMIKSMQHRNRRVFIHLVDPRTDKHEISMRKNKMTSGLRLKGLKPIPAKFIDMPNEGENPLP